MAQIIEKNFRPEQPEEKTPFDWLVDSHVLGTILRLIVKGNAVEGTVQNIEPDDSRNTRKITFKTLRGKVISFFLPDVVVVGPFDFTKRTQRR